jgi:deoxyribodipyrimidine photo-lyase
MNVLVWFKRDLRIHDHPALVLAARTGAVLPVFVVEPELWAQPETSARQWAFVEESLADLREDLSGIGAPLVVRVGDAVQVLAGLCRRHGIGQIVSHAETGTPWTEARNRRVADWARAAGIIWTELVPPGVLRGQTGASLPAPALLGMAGVEPGLIPSARALKLAADPCPHRQLGGRDRGLELLDSFLSRRGEAYRVAQSCPLASERASSRLSPHLAWGTVAVGEVARATAVRQAERPGGRWGSALSAFRSQLTGREACAAGLADVPTGCLAGPPGDPERLAAWVAGETGLPFLDACLRYLRASGWLNARLRTMVASVACHQLGLDGQAVGQHLARQFTDHDPGVLWPQMRALAGTGFTQPRRLYDPVRLGCALDPAGVFTRRWLPELAAVPEAVLHAPWRWPEARRLLGQRYPEPIIDLASAAREISERSRSARRRSGPAGAAIRRGGEPAKPWPSQAQLCLPF